jgi:hypothetical protein
MSLLELGMLSRYEEIRRKNRLVDENSLEAKHANRAALQAFEQKIQQKEQEIVNHIRRSLSRHSSRGSKRSDTLERVPEQLDLSGHVEIASGIKRSGNGSGRGSKGKPSNLGSRKITE